jgi:hypothetical protein
MGGADTGPRLRGGGWFGHKVSNSRGAKWPSPCPGHKPIGQLGDTLGAGLCHSLFPSGEEEDDSGLG